MFELQQVLEELKLLLHHFQLYSLKLCIKSKFGFQSQLVITKCQALTLHLQVLAQAKTNVNHFKARKIEIKYKIKSKVEARI